MPAFCLCRIATPRRQSEGSNSCQPHSLHYAMRLAIELVFPTKLQTRNKKSVVIVSHDLGSPDRMCTDGGRRIRCERRSRGYQFAEFSKVNASTHNLYRVAILTLFSRTCVSLTTDEEIGPEGLRKFCSNHRNQFSRQRLAISGRELDSVVGQP
jgi:hypothetical protein